MPEWLQFLTLIGGMLVVSYALGVVIGMIIYPDRTRPRKRNR